MSPTPSPPGTRPPRSAPDDALSRPSQVPSAGRRARLRARPGIGQAYRIAVFIVGLLCIALGVGLAVLPGPLTIPPVLLGLWIWSTEFRFAERLFASFQRKGREAWAHARRHPVSSAAITAGGLAAAAVAMWAVPHYDLVAKAKDAIGL